MRQKSHKDLISDLFSTSSHLKPKQFVWSVIWCQHTPNFSSSTNLIISKNELCQTDLILTLKRCVRYIFTSLLCTSKRERLLNKYKCFLFHFESSFHFRDNQILNFQIFKCHAIIKCLSMKHETHFIE